VHEGICAFEQQGCRYLHDMPSDKATQVALGLFQGYPAWWKKHQADLQRQRAAPVGTPQVEAKPQQPQPQQQQHGHYGTPSIPRAVLPASAKEALADSEPDTPTTPVRPGRGWRRDTPGSVVVGSGGSGQANRRAGELELTSFLVPCISITRDLTETFHRSPLVYGCNRGVLPVPLGCD
jgi:hypothetical protein